MRQVAEHPVAINITAEDFKYQTCPALAHSKCVTGRRQACFVLNQDLMLSVLDFTGLGFDIYII